MHNFPRIDQKVLKSTLEIIPMTRVTELTPLLNNLKLGAMAPPCPSASPWSEGNSWTTHHSWRSSSATRSIAALNVASNSG